ncbi:beta-ketoacyl-ACP synthase III [Thermosynechococcus sp. FA-CM-4201]
MTVQGVKFSGVGAATPRQCLTNAHLSALVDTSDEWIQSRTGIQERHVAAPDQRLVDLASEAAGAALQMAGLEPTAVDLIILATSTPDDLFGTACLVQTRIGAVNAVAFDLTAACSGFLFALVTAAQYLRTGAYRSALVIGGDILSRWVDWSDRRTCILFGDGAGAMVLQASEADQLLSFELRSDGRLNEHLTLAFAGTPQTLGDNLAIAQGGFAPIAMNGREVYRFAVTQVPEVIEKALHRAGCTVEEIDWLVLHQANQRILDAVAERLGIPQEKVISNVGQCGNTSAASIPLALAAPIQQGHIQPGDLIATAGFGAGLTWGAALFRWQ